MKATKIDKKNSALAVKKAARSVSFNQDVLSAKHRVTKVREQYIKSVSAKALSAISA